MGKDLPKSKASGRTELESMEEKRQEYIAKLHGMIDTMSEEDLSYVFDIVEAYIDCRKRLREEEKGTEKSAGKK